MPHKLPVCKNQSCPKFKTNDEVMVLVERKEDVSFGCKACGGVEVKTLDWRRADQGNYEIKTRPEYARIRRRFFQGRNSHVGG